MAINNYVLSATVTVPAGTAATVIAGEPGTGGVASLFGTEATVAGTYGDVRPTTFRPGQLIALDPAGQLFAAIGGGNLRQVTRAQETGGGYNSGGTSN
ncbi:MAG: hypothetical protein ACRDOK_25940 [Streptosporangiaceae bacterium]